MTCHTNKKYYMEFSFCYRNIGIFYKVKLAIEFKAYGLLCNVNG